MKEKIEKALADIRPSLQADGGDVELVEVENGIVKGSTNRCLRRVPPCLR